MSTMSWVTRVVGRQLLKQSIPSNSITTQIQISQIHTLVNTVSSLFKRTPGVLSRVVLQAHPSFDNNNCGTTVPAREMSHRSRQKGIQKGPLAPGSLWQKRSDGLLHPENVGSQKVNPRRRCKYCYVVYEGERKFVFCDKYPRHKQVGRIPIGVAKASRIMTHATQGGHKNGSMFMWTQQSMREDY